MRILIVDDNDAVRHALALSVESFEDLEVVGKARDGEEALNLCEEVQPDVVVMDMVMPRMDGLSATRYIHQRYPKIKIIALTQFEGRTLSRRLLEGGAVACLHKSTSIDQIVATIRAFAAYS